MDVVSAPLTTAWGVRRYHRYWYGRTGTLGGRRYHDCDNLLYGRRTYSTAVRPYLDITRALPQA